MNVWKTSIKEPNHRFSYWQEAIGEEILTLQLARRQNNNPFNATLNSISVSDISINKVHSSEHTAALTQDMIGDLTNFYYFLIIQTSAQVLVKQHNCDFRLGIHDAILVDGSSPFILDFPETFGCYSIRIPGQQLNPLIDDPIRAVTTPISGRSALGRAIVNYVLFTQNTFANPDQQGLLVDNLLGLIALATSASEMGIEYGKVSRKVALYNQIKQFISQQIDNPHLTADLIAQQFYISVSYVYKLFAESGESLGEHIRSQRLEHVALALRDDTYSAYTVSDIALQYGFTDMSYFWRLFKKKFQMTPIDYRGQK